MGRGAPSLSRRSGRGQGGLLVPFASHPRRCLALQFASPSPAAGGGGTRGPWDPAALGPGPGRAPRPACLVAAGKCYPLCTGRAGRRSTRGGRRRARAGGKKFPGGLTALARGPGHQRGRARPDSTPWRSACPIARPPSRPCALREGGLVVGSHWSPQRLSCSTSGLERRGTKLG